MTRYYAEEPCVHGEIREHRTGPFKAGGKTSWGTCSGVVRRELTIDLAAELVFARNAIQSWAGYASDYFKDKWDLDGDLARIDAAVAALGDPV